MKQRFRETGYFDKNKIFPDRKDHGKETLTDLLPHQNRATGLNFFPEASILDDNLSIIL
jgi:hypothetical protein